MEFGLFSNGLRPARETWDALDEDLYEVMLADEQGFEEAWISEHAFPAELVICKLAALTKQIKLGPGVRGLPLYHPMEIVVEANTCDHLTYGRYMLGLGMGFAPLKAEQRGIPVAKRRAMMHEAIDFIVKTYSASEPFEFHGEFYQGRNIDMRPPPYQKPHPPIGIACHETTETAEIAGRHGFQLLFSQADTAENMRGQIDAFLAAAMAAGRPPRRADVRATRLVYVSDSVSQARDELRASVTAYVEVEKELQPHLLARTVPPGGTLQDVTFDYLVDIDHYVIGDPDTVCEKLTHFYEVSGGFGLLMLLAGKDYGTREQRARSLRLFATEVAPRLRDLDADRDPPAPSS